MLSLTVTPGSDEMIHDTCRFYLRLSSKSVGPSAKLLGKQFYGRLFFASVTCHCQCELSSIRKHISGWLILGCARK